MKTLSKFMATTAICTVIAGTAAAQGLDADVSADIGVSADTSTSSPIEGSGGLAIDSSTGVAGDAETTDSPTMTATLDPGTGAAISAATEAMARGDAVAVLSADGRMLGQVESASQDARGAAELLISLDQTLDTSADRVTYSGMADVDSEGRVVLPLAEADFMSRIMMQTDGSAG